MKAYDKLIKQDCIDFAEWASGHGWVYDRKRKIWIQPFNPNSFVKDSEMLYEEFTKQRDVDINKLS